MDDLTRKMVADQLRLLRTRRVLPSRLWRHVSWQFALASDAAVVHHYGRRAFGNIKGFIQIGQIDQVRFGSLAEVGQTPSLGPLSYRERTSK
jgi:hypothetical protein